MKDAAPIRAALEEMGHPQPPTAIVVDNNSTASGIANKTVKQRRSKAMDMRFYWVQDRTEQRQFQGVLAERSAKFGRLFYKAPSRPLPCRHATSLLTCRFQLGLYM